MEQMIEIQGVQFTPAQVQKLLSMGVLGTELQQRTGNPIQKHDLPSAVANSTPWNGPQGNSETSMGMFSAPGVRPDVFSAYQRPRSLARILGVQQSMLLNEKISILTGMTADDAASNNATDFCDNDPPHPGQFKRCTQNSIWGSWMMRTNVASLQKAGMRYDRADMEKRILNFANDPNPFVPDTILNANVGTGQGRLLAESLFTIGASLERTLEQVLVQGITTQTTTYTGWIRPFDGLQRQIRTGYVDLDNSIPCPAADSLVVAYNGAVDGTGTDGRDIVQTISDTVYSKTELAMQVGINDAQWVFVMAPRLFRRLTEVWACSYATTRCTGTAGNPNGQDAATVKNFELSMLNGRYLTVDGVNYPVVLSQGVPEAHEGGSTMFNSDIFFVPIRGMGRNLINIEYFPLNNGESNAFFSFVGGDDLRYLNNGMFAVTSQKTAFCKEYLFAGEMRMILDARFLAARIDDISYTYRGEYRSPYPGDTINYVDGGVTQWAG